MPDDPLRAWHRANRRPLRVRDAREPWPVLVLEVMSQQTQIDRVGDAWDRFIRRWPTPADLAGASTRDLLDEWAGLGYNRRALALREAARTILEVHGGHVPADLAELMALPGIGAYTARAILASAFGVPVAPLDVNVRRVVSRLAGIGPFERGLQPLADARVWPDDPRGWVEAVMDLAVGVCRPKRPACSACPVAGSCASRGTQGDPPRAARPEPFTASRRWLRGEILRRLRATPDGAWLRFEGPLGRHDEVAVLEALAGLQRDGFLDGMPGDVAVARIRGA